MNIYQQSYMKQCKNLYPSRNIYPSNYVSASENTIINTGFLRLNIIDQNNGTPVSNTTITIYVTDGTKRAIPIMHLITTINPIRIELPMANELGTKIVGPEYDFSTYDLRVDAFGYLSSNMYNIRLFPNITSEFEISLIPISQIQKKPVKIEERINIPAHPRDVLN